ncbi:MAG: hypothetical protein LIO87_07595, partial [Eubacterium sp.]|nr:hypothetical protein [Eubacterium sp.]
KNLGEWIKLPDSIGGGYLLIFNDVFIVFNEADKDTGNRSKAALNDYKLWCFNGQAKIMLVCTERYSEKGLCEDFFDMEWNHLKLRRSCHPCAEKNIEKPKCFGLMRELAEKLSKDLPFVRVDFYEICGQVYFGEITFYPSSGVEAFLPEQWDINMGNWIIFPNKNI